MALTWQCSRSVSHLPSYINWDANDHGRDRDASNQRDAYRRTDQSAKLPQDLFLSTPWLFPPKSTTWWTEKEQQIKTAWIVKGNNKRHSMDMSGAYLQLLSTALRWGDTWGSAGQRFPSYTASRTRSHTLRRSCDYSFRHSSWWCMHRIADRAWCHQLSGD